MTDCCTQPGLIPIETARATLLRDMIPVEDTETIPLAQACGRVLAAPQIAGINLPPCDNSAMDGYALRFADLEDGKPLRLAGSAFAGRPFSGEVAPGTCVRIMTGAALPAGADTVVMQEQVERQGKSVFVRGTLRRGEHIRRRGEDVAEGDALLDAGTRLSVARIALLAAVGIGVVTVHRRPVIALFSTGDELRPPGAALCNGEIYDCNRTALLAALTQLGVDTLDLGILPDDKAIIREKLARAARDADAIITSGGVSVGDADYTREVLEEMGRVNFWKVAMKPGKPFAYGHLQGTPFFGLPGNPVSALITFQQLVVPALTAMQGGTWCPPVPLRAKLGKALKKKPGRTDFQRGIYRRDPAGGLSVEPAGNQGSHILSGLAEANCLIILPRDSGNADSGDSVAIEPLEVPLAP
ncbi:molybdopterin molybdotransferase MoeA [Microbulbifer thermotolerans]|uniref:molybdopterin molybdotransferase MoeA n=1 Tax=Microbulbifer thermotolerans TaxID=252514 RepID=UPI002248D6D5|nr:gephyrin-like molybdotransferase Glp [Microbulbifer thermotolerans]MCX2793502.1 molybdopterin molybdotransferase MoeA [Microbulbifer thermotolerans]